MSRKLVLLTGLIVVLAGTLGLAFNVRRVEASGTIYIRANGDVEGTDKIDRVGEYGYIFTDNINDSIYVERDNIVVDGAGYILQGVGEGPGIYVSGRGNVTIKNVEIKAFWFGIEFHDALNDNTICGNTIADNVIGISLYRSSENTVFGNNITQNTQYGIRIGSSSNNIIYHNNFVDNTEQVYSMNATSVWDDGYPSGGNYWSDYTDVDQHSGPYQSETGSDGIWDHQYDIVDLFYDNQDNYPLVATISFFDAGTRDKATYYVHTVSNSTVSDFSFSEDDKMIRFNVTGQDDTSGFCRVAVPRALLWCEDISDWTVEVNSTSVETRIQETSDYTYIYFTYGHSTKEVEIEGTYVIPEFSSFIILSLFMIAILLAVIVYRRLYSKRRELGKISLDSCAQEFSGYFLCVFL